MKSSANQKSFYNKIKLNILKERLIDSGDLVFLALSGGPDSIFLCEVLLLLQKEIKFELRACHFNHKLRGEAGDADQKFVEDYCKSHNIELTLGERQQEEPASSEEEARELRYNFFEKISGQGRGKTKIATAHHMDDLVETYLMRLIRGSGLKGLSSILPRRKNFIRPLLFISKKEILDYLNQQQISYCIDQTNFEEKFTRNRIRNDLIPELLTYNSKVKSAIAQTVLSNAEDNDFMESCARGLFARIVTSSEGKLSIDLGEFLSLHPAVQKRLVIYCIEKLGGRDYTFDQINSIIRLALRNIGKKELPLPYSLRFRLESGKIYMYKKSVNSKENDGKSQKK